MADVLREEQEAIAEQRERYGVARLDVFGSLPREDYRRGESDIDLLVEFGPHEGCALVEACVAIDCALQGPDFESYLANRLSQPAHARVPARRRPCRLADRRRRRVSAQSGV